MPLFGAATLPAVPVGPTPFTRKNWDNPVRFKLNRAYGDEFEYSSFAQLTRRWTPAGATPPVAGDFGFPGGSSIEWLPVTGVPSSALQIAAPSGDFEAVLEFSTSRGHSLTAADWMFAPGLVLIDSVGVGAGAAPYIFDGNVYSTTLITNIISTATNNFVAGGPVWDGRHMWLAMRRTGTNLQVRFSINGSTFTSLSTGVTVSATAPFLAIAKINPTGATIPAAITLHRLNVYPGSTFFTG